MSQYTVPPRYPWEGHFVTVEEIRDYFANEKVTCLLCGKEYDNLGLHITATHKITKDDYKEKYGIPWSYGLAGEKFKTGGSKRFKEMRKAGKIAQSPSKEHMQKLRLSNRKRRPAVEAFRNDSRRKALEQHGRTEKWGEKDLEEYLRRIATGRTPVEVGQDKDMPTQGVFYRYVKSNPDFRKRYEKIWNDLPYKVHVRAGKPTEKFENEVVKLRCKNMTLPEIAEKLDVSVHAVRCAWHRLKKQGRLDAADLEHEYQRYSREDYDEYLRRIASGRMITDVGRDDDMPQSVLFYIYMRKNQDFKKKFQAMWETLPYDQQARSRRMGRAFKKDVARLQQKDMTWDEIGKALGVKPDLAKKHFKP